MTWRTTAPAGRSLVGPDGSEFTLTGLPLEPVDMTVEITAADLEPGTQFPPDRLFPRLSRMGHRADANRGNFRAWSVDRAIIGYGWIETYWEIMSTLLLAEEPGPELPTEQRASIIDAVPLLLSDMGDHGGGIVIGYPDLTVEALPFSNSFPTPDGGWVVVEPFTSSTAPSADADRATVIVWTPDGDDGTGLLETTERVWTGSQDAKPVAGKFRVGVLGDAAGTEERVEGVRLAEALMPPRRGGWGRGRTDKLISVAANLALGYASLTAAVIDNMQPRLLVLGQLEDLKAYVARPGESPTQISTEEMRRRLPSLSGREMAVVEGVRDIKWLVNDSDFSAAFDLIDLTTRQWVEETGLPPLESADGAAAQSGVAVARKSGLAVARGQSWQTVQHEVFTAVRGGAGFEWEQPSLIEMERPDDDTDPDDDPGEGDDA